MEKLKICYIVTIGLTIKSFFVPQLQMLSNNGFDVSVVCSPDDSLETVLGSSIHYYPVTIPRGLSFVGMIKAFFGIYSVLRKNRFDLVQYSTPNAGLVSSFASKLLGIKKRNYHLMGIRYLGEDGLKRKFLKELEKITCRLSTNVECVSYSNLDLAIKERLFPREKGVVVFHGSSGGIDTVRFSITNRVNYRKRIRTEYGLREESFVFGFVGRVTRDKGVNEILSAFSKLHNCKLMIIGYLDEIESLDADLYKNSLQNPNIIYTGPVNCPELYYSALDCLLLPSYREGFGNVIIEAAAMGTPAIVSNIPGPIDTSIENKTAIWIPPRDEIALYNAMEHIQTIDYVKMGIDAAVFVRKNFDQTVVNDYILKRKISLLG